MTSRGSWSGKSTRRCSPLPSCGNLRAWRTATASPSPPTTTSRAKSSTSTAKFPITIPAAQYAKSLGFYTVVGAPNILRGGSHSGNMSAAEAVQAGCADILCSDYYPPAILHGVFLLHSKYGLPLPEVVRKATRNPALAVGLPDYGEIAPGRKADLLIVEILDNYPVITHVLVDGRATSRVEYRR